MSYKGMDLQTLEFIQLYRHLRDMLQLDVCILGQKTVVHSSYTTKCRPDTEWTRQNSITTPMVERPPYAIG